MTAIVKPNIDELAEGLIGTGGLQAIVEKTGRLPPLTLLISPLEGGFFGSFKLNRFLSYSFQSSVIVPVDTFSFNFVAPDGDPLPDQIKEGDIAILTANDVPLATGIIDQVEVETDSEWGEKGMVTGRDLMGQLEDQDAISFDSSPIYPGAVPIDTGVLKLCADTRISDVILKGDVPSLSFLLATEPGESKLAALQRFLEPLNCVAWMAPNGKMNVGKPNMNVIEPSGTLVIDKENGYSNVLSMKVTRASTQIPNIIVPIWAGQETTVNRVGIEQALVNSFPGPNRLLKLGHRVPKSVVISTPQATDAQGLSNINALSAGGGNLLQSYAKREMARHNIKGMQVQVVAAGHYNVSGFPFIVDTVYHIIYDRGRVDENMYLYQLEYQLTEDGGQRTNLWFCQLGAIVADNTGPGA